MKQGEKKLTFGAVNTIAHHRDQMDRKCQEIGWMLTGREQPLLPKDWTDEDAWKLAGSLAKLMAQVKRARMTVFDEKNPYPSHDTPLEDIPYYNPYNLDPGEDPTTPPDIPIELWTEVLHCGILAAAGKPDFCFPSRGTFADLENLFLGITRSGGGPVVNFGYVLDQLQSSLTEENYQELKELDFGPVPPSFREPKDSMEESNQVYIEARWHEWAWLNRFPFRDTLLQAIERVWSDELYDPAMRFINNEIGLGDGLRLAIDLYLYQAGASGMLEDSYYATYAMLCRTKKQMCAAKAAEA